MTARPRRADAGPFGPPAGWPDDDLVAVSHDIDVDLTLAGYASGVFPMPLQPGLMGWWSPVDRGVLPLDALRVPRSLRKMLPRYEIRIDTAFPAVLAACADPRRPHGWIDDDFLTAYCRLHDLGWAHSIETWQGEVLAGGVYGVRVGGLFAGESMFHRVTDASKVALWGAVELLRMDGVTLFDVQWTTPHLESLGAVDVSRAEYSLLLDAAVGSRDG